MRVIFFLSLIFIFWTHIQLMFVAAQDGPTPNQLASKILRDANGRNLDSLMDSLSTHDGGNHDLVAMRGMLGGGFEVHSVFQQVVADERVLKAYEKLKSLRSDEAAKIVTRSFQADLEKVKKEVAKQGFIEEPSHYGLHAKLWLSFEFGNQDDFNQQFRDWNDWSVHAKIKGKPTSVGPELLMYLNLVLLEEQRSGIEIEKSGLSEIVSEAGIDQPFDSMLNEVILEAVSPSEEELGKVKIFIFWNGLDVLSVEERYKLMRRAGALIDPKLKPGPLETLAQDLSSLVHDSILNLKKSFNVRRKPAMEIEFLSTSSSPRERSMSRGWNSNLPPGKDDLMAAIFAIRKGAEPDERERWDESIEAIRKWLSDLPDEGIEAKKKRIYFQWPEDENKARFGKPLIRLSMRDVKALEGQLTKSDTEKDRQSRDDD